METMRSVQSGKCDGDYLAIADMLADDIAAGRLRSGQQLVPQRRFARVHGIAASTAARVYGELIRRGLAVGEVGRGTFVRSGEAPVDPALAEPGDARVDLELNFPVLPQQAGLLASSLARMLRPDVLSASLHPVGAVGTPSARAAASETVALGDWVPEPHQILFAGNGRQAIAATLAALVPPGQRLGVESATYPVAKAIAARLGITLVPIEMDEHGLDPDALRSIHRSTPLRALYLQPSLHNPLGTTMPERRRGEIADTLRKMDLTLVEDAIYGFLHDETPVAALAPAHTVLVDSLSKRLAPGLSLGFAVTPRVLGDSVATALRSGAWSASRFALDAATGWMSDGTAAAIGRAKRHDAQTRQTILRECLAGFVVHADPRAYHAWWQLPEPWRAETFVAAAARRGIAITPAAAFTVGPGSSPNAVRLALASPPLLTLTEALNLLAALANATPEDTGVD
jgi:DNA-binding transcriptional MocR family regulator